jgi:hypothetical protein
VNGAALGVVAERATPGDFVVEGLFANTEAGGFGVASSIVFAGGEARQAFVGLIVGFVWGWGGNQEWTRINANW